MPSYKTHIVLGIVFVAVVLIINWKYFHFLKFGSPWEYLIFLPILIFYAMLPDIDHRISQPRLIATLVLALGTMYFIIVEVKTKALLSIGMLILIWVLEFLPGFDHRGHVHSIIMIFVLSVPLYWLGGFTLMILGFLFAFSHLLFDKVLKLW